MVYKPKCINGMHSKTNTEFSARVREIQNKLVAAGPLFSTLVPQPTTVLQHLDQLDAWQAQSNSKNYENVAPMRVLRHSLDGMLTRQCEGVNMIAQGDVGTMVLSGFDLNKVPTPRQVPDQGFVKKVKNLDENTVVVYVKALRTCSTYDFKFEGPNGFKRYVHSTHAKLKEADLPAGVTLTVKVRGFNNKGNGMWSAPLSFVVNIAPQTGDNSDGQ